MPTSGSLQEWIRIQVLPLDYENCCVSLSQCVTRPLHHLRKSSHVAKLIHEDLPANKLSVLIILFFPFLNVVIALPRLWREKQTISGWPASARRGPTPEARATFSKSFSSCSPLAPSASASSRCWKLDPQRLSSKDVECFKLPQVNVGFHCSEFSQKFSQKFSAGVDLLCTFLCIQLVRKKWKLLPRLAQLFYFMYWLFIDFMFFNNLYFIGVQAQPAMASGYDCCHWKCVF